MFIEIFSLVSYASGKCDFVKTKGFYNLKTKDVFFWKHLIEVASIGFTKKLNQIETADHI